MELGGCGENLDQGIKQPIGSGRSLALYVLCAKWGHCEPRFVGHGQITACRIRNSFCQSLIATGLLNLEEGSLHLHVLHELQNKVCTGIGMGLALLSVTKQAPICNEFLCLENSTTTCCSEQHFKQAKRSCLRSNTCFRSPNSWKDKWQLLSKKHPTCYKFYD